MRFYVVGSGGVRRLEGLDYACFLGGILRGCAEVWAVGPRLGRAARFTGSCFRARPGARRLTKARAADWGVDWVAGNKPDHFSDPVQHTLWCFEDAPPPEPLERLLVETCYWAP